MSDAKISGNRFSIHTRQEYMPVATRAAEALQQLPIDQRHELDLPNSLNQLKGGLVRRRLAVPLDQLEQRIQEHGKVTKEAIALLDIVKFESWSSMPDAKDKIALALAELAHRAGTTQDELTQLAVRLELIGSIHEKGEVALLTKPQRAALLHLSNGTLADLVTRVGVQLERMAVDGVRAHLDVSPTS